MRSYLNIVDNILSEGQMKENRTGTRALTTFCEIFRHDMSTGFPLLTTKKMYTRGIAVELEGFIQGITNKHFFKDRKCNIWNDWCSNKKVPYGHDAETLKNMKEEPDLGKIYGYSWRNFGANTKSIVKVPKPEDNLYKNKNYPEEATNCGVAIIGNPQKELDKDTENILYKNWYDMINRCYNPKASQYKYYGEKGMRVVDEWLIYANYRKDIKMLPRWQDKMRSPRQFHLNKDYFGHSFYSPDNCVFLNHKENILYNSSSYYHVYDVEQDQTYEFLSKRGIGAFLGFNRKSVDTYIDQDKTYKKRYTIRTAAEEEYLYRYKLPFDQLQHIVNKLKTDPNDRRMVVSAWEPSNFDDIALHPCHVMFHLTYVNNKVNLVWFQRSNDFLIGNPYNIASYALLLTLICQTVGMEPGELVGIFSDCHIYEDHIEQVKEQLTRDPYPLPKVKIESNNIFEWTHEDLEIEDYQYHPSIKYPIAI